MAIDDKVVSKFSNENLRPLADKLCGLYLNLVEFVKIYEGREIENYINNMKEQVLVDGSAEDGRRSINGDEIQKFKSVVSDLNQYFEDNKTLTQLMFKICVNPKG